MTPRKKEVYKGKSTIRARGREVEPAARGATGALPGETAGNCTSWQQGRRDGQLSTATHGTELLREVVSVKAFQKSKAVRATWRRYLQAQNVKKRAQ